MRIDVRSRQASDFAINRVPGPSDATRNAGLDRPSDLAFAPNQSLYVVDWGAMGTNEKDEQPAPLTGAIWRIYPKREPAVRPSGPVVVSPPDKTLGSGRMAAAPTLGGSYQDILRIVGLIVVSFVVAIGTMVLGRRYWMR